MLTRSSTLSIGLGNRAPIAAAIPICVCKGRSSIRKISVPNFSESSLDMQPPMLHKAASGPMDAPAIIETQPSKNNDACEREETRV